MILLSDMEHNSKWVEHFNEVLNQPVSIILLDLIGELNVTDDVDISMNDISKDETGKGLRPHSKAAGLDFIPAELLKWGDAMVFELTQTASMVWNNLEVPYKLNCGAIVKLQKRGNLSEYDHWRGVTFLIIRKYYSQCCWDD